MPASYCDGLWFAKPIARGVEDAQGLAQHEAALPARLLLELDVDRTARMDVVQAVEAHLHARALPQAPAI